MDTLDDMPAVAAYFNRYGRRGDKITANYLAGCVFRDKGDAPRALKYYRDAVALADTASASCDFSQLARIYGQMGILFHQQRSPRHELQADSLSYDYAVKARDTLFALFAYRDFAAPYYFMGDDDKALDITLEAHRRFLRYGYREYAASCLAYAVSVHLHRHQYAEARTYMDEYIRYSGFFNAEGDIDSSHIQFYGNIGQYYEGIHKTDSALYYYRKLQQKASSPDAQVMVCRGLMSVYQQKHTTDSVVKYALLLEQANDSAMLQHASDEIIRMQSLYNYEENRREAQQKAAKARRYQMTLWGTLGLACLSGLFICLYIKRRTKMQQEALARSNQQYLTTLSQYRQARKDLKTLQDSTDRYIRKKETEVRALEERLNAYDEIHEIAKEDVSDDADIVREFHRMATTLKMAESEDWMLLESYMDVEYPEFARLLNRKKLSNVENRVARLIRLCFISSEILVLLGISKSRLSNIRASINKKLFHVAGTSRLDYRIRQM